MNKPLRKLTTKKLFGTKVHEEMIIPVVISTHLGVTVYKDEGKTHFYLNGNLIESPDGFFYTIYKNIDWINSDWNWITFGLFNSMSENYNFDHLPNSGYTKIINVFDDITRENNRNERKKSDSVIEAFNFDVFKTIFSWSSDPIYYGESFLINLKGADWLEGTIKAFEIDSPSSLNNVDIDCCYLNAAWTHISIGELNINPEKFHCGVYKGYSKYGERENSFLNKKLEANGEFHNFELIKHQIGKYLIISDSTGKEYALKLHLRYNKIMYDQTKTGEYELISWAPRKLLVENIINHIKGLIEIDKDFKFKTIEEYASIVKEEYIKVKEICYPVFSYTIYPTHQEISIPWESIRSNYENKGYIKVGKPFNLCGHLDIKEVKNIRIADEFDYIPDLNTSIELNQEIGFKDYLKIELSFDLKEDFFAFQELKKDIYVNGLFLSNMRDLSDLVKKGYISGYDSVFELKAFFDNQGAIDYGTENVKEKVAYLKTIKNVFIDNIVESSQKQQVIDIIKNIIHSNSNDSQSIDKSNLKSIDIDFSKDPRIGVSSKVEFLVITENDENQLNKFLKEVETGEFYSNLVRIKKLVTNSYITGYYNRLEIKDFFNEQGGNEPDNTDVKKALNYLCDLSNNIIPKVKETMISDALKSIIKLTING